MEYYECGKGESQYDDIDLAKNKIVPARYVPARVPMDAGNPYIEALPIYRDADKVYEDYSKPIPGYHYEDVKGMDKVDKMLNIGTLRTLRFTLPHHKKLEFDMYNTLVESYRARMQMKGSGRTYMMNDEEQETTSILIGESRCSTAGGFYMTGHSGSGKTSSLEILTDRYPQVIMHTDGKGHFPQIPYIVVNCGANSNFEGLYQAFGNALDMALGDMDRTHEDIISRLTGLGKKREKMREWIETFAIGIIIFDEIQNISFSHTASNTYDEILTIANETKVGLAVIGTEEARKKMFPELRTARRIGASVNAERYCDDKGFYAKLVKGLYNYQWFDTWQEPTQDVIDALYETSKGLIDETVGIFQYLQYDYTMRKKKPKVDGDYVRAIAKEYFPGMQEILSHTVIDEDQLAKVKASADLKYQDMLDRAKQEEEMIRIEDEEEKRAKDRMTLENVTAMIRTLHPDYTPASISKAYKSVMNRKSSADKTESEIAQEVLKQLQKEPKPKKGKAPGEDDLKKFLGADKKEKTS